MKEEKEKQDASGNGAYDGSICSSGADEGPGK